MVTTKNCQSNLLNTKEGIHKLLQQMWFSQHNKLGLTHQSLACATERVGLFNLPKWGRSRHLYCGKGSTRGNQLYRQCSGWKYWHIDSPYPSLEQLKKWRFLQHWEKTKVKQSDKWWNIECFKEGKAVFGWMIFYPDMLRIVEEQHWLLIAKVSYFTYFLRLCYIFPLKNWTLILK